MRRYLLLIINLSLTEGCMPDPYKLAILFSQFKRETFELILLNYCPISNLCFISKNIEKAACDQIVEHMIANHLYEKYQSAYT